MLPQLTENGYLPEGVWDCSMEELRKKFGVFRGSDQRPKLFNKLEEFLAEIYKTGWIEEVIIDGSFVTGKEDPNDIDIILALREPPKNVETPFWIARILSQQTIRKKYGFDVIIVLYKSPKHIINLDFFQQVRQSDLRKAWRG